jgi:tetratricopeptide (TPR) repeat protein
VPSVHGLAQRETLRLIAGLSRRRPERSALSLTVLFSRLAAAEAAEDALRIEDCIWSQWMSDPNAGAERALDLAAGDIAAGRFDIAETRLERLVRARPDFVEAWHKLGLLHGMLGRDEESLHELRRSLELEPRHFAALGAIGEILSGKRDGEGAVLAYRAALRVHPHMGSARERLAQILGAG